MRSKMVDHLTVTSVFICPNAVQQRYSTSVWYLIVYSGHLDLLPSWKYAFSAALPLLTFM